MKATAAAPLVEGKGLVWIRSLLNVLIMTFLTFVVVLPLLEKFSQEGDMVLPPLAPRIDGPLFLYVTDAWLSAPI